MNISTIVKKLKLKFLIIKSTFSGKNTHADTQQKKLEKKIKLKILPIHKFIFL